MTFIFSDFFVVAAALLLKRNVFFFFFFFFFFSLMNAYVFQNIPKNLRNCRHTGPAFVCIEV